MAGATERVSAPAAQAETASVVPIDSLPSALDAFDEIATRVDGLTPILCLDFDGTLSPIVDEPTAARLLDGVADILHRLVERVPILILSGRDADDVCDRVAVDGILYAGSHGFDVLEAGGRHEPNAEAIAYLPHLDALEARLRSETQAIPGVVIDRKRFGVAVHDRQVAAEHLEGLWEAVNTAGRAFPMLRPMRGKRVTEFLPEIDWNKGRALLWLLGRAGYRADVALPICIGDDMTDEDALRAVRDRGIGIVVGSGARASAATYAVHDPTEVLTFLTRLAAFLDSRPVSGPPTSEPD